MSDEEYADAIEDGPDVNVNVDPDLSPATLVSRRYIDMNDDVIPEKVRVANFKEALAVGFGARSLKRHYDIFSYMHDNPGLFEDVTDADKRRLFGGSPGANENADDYMDIILDRAIRKAYADNEVDSTIAFRNRVIEEFFKYRTEERTDVPDDVVDFVNRLSKDRDEDKKDLLRAALANPMKLVLRYSGKRSITEKNKRKAKSRAERGVVQKSHMPNSQRYPQHAHLPPKQRAEAYKSEKLKEARLVAQQQSTNPFIRTHDSVGGGGGHTTAKKSSTVGGRVLKKSPTEKPSVGGGRALKKQLALKKPTPVRQKVIDSDSDSDSESDSDGSPKCRVVFGCRRKAIPGKVYCVKHTREGQFVEARSCGIIACKNPRMKGSDYCKDHVPSSKKPAAAASPRKLVVLGSPTAKKPGRVDEDRLYISGGGSSAAVRDRLFNDMLSGEDEVERKRKIAKLDADRRQVEEARERQRVAKERERVAKARAQAEAKHAELRRKIEAEKKRAREERSQGRDDEADAFVRRWLNETLP